MNCEQVEELLSAYLDNQLATEERREIASHLHQCRQCNAILTEFRRNDALLRHLPRVSPDPALRERIFSSPEYIELTGTFDARGSAPEEDWTAGLPIVRRGIQFEDWDEVVAGILLSLEQTENYERERGPEGSRDKWHDRSVGIDEPTRKGVDKWMPAELMKLAERQTKK